MGLTSENPTGTSHSQERRAHGPARPWHEVPPPDASGKSGLRPGRLCSPGVRLLGPFWRVEALRAGVGPSSICKVKVRSSRFLTSLQDLVLPCAGEGARVLWRQILVTAFTGFTQQCLRGKRKPLSLAQGASRAAAMIQKRWKPTATERTSWPVRGRGSLSKARGGHLRHHHPGLC